jgi:hypothetical protein
MTTTTFNATRFRLFGYTVLPGALTTAQSARVFADMDRVMETGTGLRGTTDRRSVRNFAGTSQVMADIVTDLDLPTIAAGLLGDEARYVFGDASVYHGDTRWHRDTRLRAVELVKFVFYDRALTADTGALRILPGSHRTPDATFPDQAAADLPAVALPTAVGDIIGFTPTALHGAFGAALRRQIAVTYAAVPRDPIGHGELAQLLLADHTIV